MTLRRPRFSKIVQLTDGLLDDFGVRRPSVDVADLLSREGVEVRYGNLGEVSGLIARQQGVVTIGVNLNQPPVRQRFTMAHEYGHYLLHAGIMAHADENFRIRYRNDVSSTASNVEEIEANFFAASLLMPKKFLDRLDAESSMDNDDEVREVAARFQVSQHAMSLRLSNLYSRSRPF